MSSRSSPGPLRIGDVFLEKYQILEIMGRGGYGCVYRAESLFMGREVAIKVLDRPGGLSEEMRARGQREAVALGKLSSHPNIVDVHDAGISPEGHLYLVMELLRGQNLAQRLKGEGPFGVAEGLRFILALTDALEFARGAKVVHRDLKPANIFITDEGATKILDFGVSKIAGSSGFQTAPNLVVGTALYVSPEQVRAQPATHLSDIYALGLVAYQLFCGEHPLLLAAPDVNRRDPRAVWALHVRTQARRLDTVIVGFPEYVARLVNTAMAKEPAQRYATAEEFGRRTRQALTRYENDLALERRSAVRKDQPRPEPSVPEVVEARTQPLYGTPLGQLDWALGESPSGKSAVVVPPPGGVIAPGLGTSSRDSAEPAEPTRTPSTVTRTVAELEAARRVWTSRLALPAVVLAGLACGLGLVFALFPEASTPQAVERKNVSPPHLPEEAAAAPTVARGPGDSGAVAIRKEGGPSPSTAQSSRPEPEAKQGGEPDRAHQPSVPSPDRGGVAPGAGSVASTPASTAAPEVPRRAAPRRPRRTGIVEAVVPEAATDRAGPSSGSPPTEPPETEHPVSPEPADRSDGLTDPWLE